MTQNGFGKEYRIKLGRNSEDASVVAPHFTVIVSARDPEDAIAEAEKLNELHQGRFHVLEILESSTPVAAHN